MARGLLAHLASLPEFIELDLNYPYFNKMDTQLLFDFARSCPHLDTIQIIDYNPATTFRRTRLGDWRLTPFQTEDISKLFAAGAELPSYFEQ